VVATGLAAIMRGEDAGYTADQAWVAAGLYYLWRMPVEPATVVLSDRRTSVRAHVRALRALRDRWGVPQVRSPLLDALCGLALRSQGLYGASPYTRSRPEAQLSEEEQWAQRPETLLSEEEQWLLNLIQRALLEGEAQGMADPVSLDGLLPSPNPVFDQVERYLAAGRRAR
jgi:hypothetical protein